jgi:hypothetical protein
MKTKLPAISHLTPIIKHLKKQICDDYIAEDDILPSIDITIGYTPRKYFSDDLTDYEDEKWNYQSGDNSYSGSAYGHPIWVVATIYRRSNSTELAKELIRDLGNDFGLEDYETY